MSKSYKLVQDTGTPRDLVYNAIQDIEDMKGELEEWRDGLEGTGLSGSEKYSSLSEAIDTMEQVNISTPHEWPHTTARISYTFSTPRRTKRRPSRQVRFDNAMSQIQAVIDFYSNLDDAEEHRELIDELENCIVSVEIPGMYG